MVWFRKRHFRAVVSALIADLTPQIEDAKGLLQVCQTEETPRAISEAGIAALFAAHKSVLAATDKESERAAILPPVHESFLARFGPIASQVSISDQGLVELVARRLATYDSLMDSSLPNWQYRLAEELYENMSGKRSDAALFAALGIAFLAKLNATADFVKKVLH